MRRRTHGFTERCERLLSLVDDSEAEERILTQLACTRDADKGLSFAKLRVLTNLDSRALDKRLTTLSGSQKVFCFDKEQRLSLSADILDHFCLSCEKAVADFHARYGERLGMPRSEILSGWGKNLAPKLVHFVVERLIKKGALIAEHDLLRLPVHNARFSKEQAPLSEAILSAHRQAGMTPPNLNEVLESIGVGKKEAATVMNALRASGQLVRVAEGVWYANEHLNTIEAIIREWFQTHESIDLAGLKSVTGLSRKYLVALLEYFDARRITMRVGDVRVLRRLSDA